MDVQVAGPRNRGMTILLLVASQPMILGPPQTHTPHCLLTVVGLMENLPSPSPRLYSMRAKLPESASVAVTVRITVPTGTSSKTAS